LKLDIKDKIPKLAAKKHFKLIAAFALIFILIIGCVSVKTFFSSNKSVTQKTAVVKKGNLSATVNGSGILSSSNESKLNAEISGKVTKVNYKEGDMVKAGDVILEFDDKDAKTSIAGSVNGLAQSQASAQSSYNNYNDLTIKAPFSGKVSKINVNQGDKIQAGGAVLTISDTKKLKVLLSYNAKDSGNIAVGQSADVYLTSLMESVNGTVTYVSNESSTTSSGGLVNTVEISMDNPGAVVEGTTASAEINTAAGIVTSTNTAAISYVNKQTVTSTTGGTIGSISVKENQNVSSGQIMVNIKNDDVSIAKNIANLKIAASENQVTSSLNLASKYRITAPYDGIIKKINYEVGDSVNAGAEVSIVETHDVLQFDMQVDELDISNIAVSQKVDITLDAISETSETPMQGEVIKISPDGTTTNGVTTYSVTIKIDGDISRLKTGMNANAEIKVKSMENVLYVPIEAVITSANKNYVWIKDNDKSKSGVNEGYYANAVKKEVIVGGKTNKYIAIETGLKEGDIVILPQNKAGTSNSLK